MTPMNVLPADISNLLMCGVGFLIVYWLYRLICGGLNLAELHRNIDHNTILRYDVPHDEENQSAIVPRTYFEQLIRQANRKPPTPIQYLPNHFNIHKSSLKFTSLDEDMSDLSVLHAFKMSLILDCTTNCSVQLFWGVSKKEIDMKIFPPTPSTSTRTTEDEIDTPLLEQNENPNDSSQREEDEEERFDSSPLNIQSYCRKSPLTYLTKGPQQEVSFQITFELSTEGESLLISNRESAKYPLLIVIKTAEDITSVSSTIKRGGDDLCEYTLVHFVKNQQNYTPSISKQYLFSPSSVLELKEVYGIFDTEFIECSVCLSNETDTILLPCRHYCVCFTCAVRIDKCPFCRLRIESYLKFKDAKTNTTDDLV
eukprot:TRINITY_DN5876_c0_g1_i1.p1 TRINITY_DN5876_c0_g1~~TRINITY_DN5876_c0_g1_i1.p1  ORF type:complete len:369 (-),score=45.78 TRINITY_DN5876_c0_g1_i1:32-1138(-)